MVSLTLDNINKTEVVTVIGSTRFDKEMNDKARYLQSTGHLSLITSITKEPTYAVSEDMLMKEGYKRINLSDTVVCMNCHGYIGENTAREYQYATLVRRIPVYFDEDEVTEHMLKYLNSYFIDNEGQYRLWNYSNIEGLTVKTICIRENPIVAPDIEAMLSDIMDIDKEFYHAILSIDMRKQCKHIGTPVRILPNDIFDANVRESNLFAYNDKAEESDEEQI